MNTTPPLRDFYYFSSGGDNGDYGGTRWHWTETAVAAAGRRHAQGVGPSEVTLRNCTEGCWWLLSVPCVSVAYLNWTGA